MGRWWGCSRSLSRLTGPPTRQDADNHFCGGSSRMSIYSIDQAGFVLSGVGICEHHDGDYNADSAAAWIQSQSLDPAGWALHAGLGYRYCDSDGRGVGITLAQVRQPFALQL